MLTEIHEISFFLYNLMLIPMLFISIFFYLMAFTGIFLNTKSRRNRKKIDWPMVTVQIPTFNEPVALRCAEKCLQFDYPKNKLQIIIGDDSNDKKVSKMIDRFAKKHSRVKVTRRGSNIGFKAGNLNHMLKHSDGEIIVIFDSDFVPPKNFLKKVIPPFLEDEKIGCVQVKWNYLNLTQNKISKLASTILMVYHHILAVINDKNGVSLLFGSAEAVRKDLILKLGGWQEGSLTEDVEFSLRLLKHGYKTVYLKDFEVPGEVPFTLRGLFKQQKRWAYGNTKAFLDHKKWILFGKLSFLQKLSLVFTLLGYISAPIIIAFIILGMVSFATGEPSPINFYKFFRETAWTLFISGGFIAAGVVALFKEKKIRMFFSVLISAITFGFVGSLGATLGLIDVILKKKPVWTMIEKNGNLNFK